MPFLDAFRLREPARPPAKWLVPWWWAFASDERYKIDICKGDGKSKRRSQLGGMCPQHGAGSPGLSEPKRHKNCLRRPSADSTALSRLPQPSIQEQPRSCGQNNEVVAQESQDCNMEPSEAGQVLGPNTKSNNCGRHGRSGLDNQERIECRRLDQIDQEHHQPSYERVRQVQIHQKKGQSERRTKRNPNHTSSVDLPGHEPGCLTFKLGHSRPDLEPRSITKPIPIHPHATIHHNCQSTSAPPNQVHQDGDPTFIKGINDLQRQLIEQLAVTQGNCHRDTQQNRVNRNTVPAMKQLPTVRPHIAMCCLVEPGLMENETIWSDPKISMLPHHLYSHSLPPSVCHTLGPDHKSVNVNTPPFAQISQYIPCLSHDRPMEDPLRYSIAPSMQPRCSKYTPDHLCNNEDLYEDSCHEHHHSADGGHHLDRDHDHNQYQNHRKHMKHIKHESPSPRMPHGHINHYNHVNHHPDRHHHSEKKDQYYTHGCYAHQPYTPPYESQDYHTMNDQYTDIHYQQDLDKPPVNHHHHHHHDPTHHPAKVLPHELEQPLNPRDHLCSNIHDVRAQLGYPDYSHNHNQGRRSSYIRTRADQ